MLDFHTHILPALDDGSESINMSLKMLQESWKQGVDGLVLTPHFYADSDTPQHFLQRRAKAMLQLSQQLGRLKHCPQLLLGAEVHYYRGMGRSTALEQLCIGQSNLVLVEMPFGPWNSYMLRDIEEIHTRLGLQVIIAHIDRYIANQNAVNIEALQIDASAIIQANADFFLRRSTRRKAIKMLERREIHLLGSDCHNMSNRAPNLTDATKYIEEKLGAAELRRIDWRGAQMFHAAGAVL